MPPFGASQPYEATPLRRLERRFAIEDIIGVKAIMVPWRSRPPGLVKEGRRIGTEPPVDEGVEGRAMAGDLMPRTVLRGVTEPSALVKRESAEPEDPRGTEEPHPIFVGARRVVCRSVSNGAPAAASQGTMRRDQPRPELTKRARKSHESRCSPPQEGTDGQVSQ